MKIGACFEEFWTLYPRKVGKEAARRKFEALTIRKGVIDPLMVNRIMDGLGRLNENKPWGTDIKFCPHASTWLNQGRWEDQHEASPKVADENTTRPCPQYLRDKRPKPAELSADEKMKREERQALHADLKSQGIDWRVMPMEKYRAMLAARISDRLHDQATEIKVDNHA